MESAPSVLQKERGVTSAERYLKRLCDGTFLSLWSFPGIYKDQGIHRGLEKEVCDLLVVFGSTIIIFSDKACDFPPTDDVNLAWRRWFRKAVIKSANQAWGAERWILGHPDRLFIDRACTKRFPFQLPSKENAVVHLVVVAHYAAAYCRAYHGGSGSLMVRSDLRGIQEHVEYGPPFTIGDLDPKKSFVHVLDDTSLQVLMRALDTISDFALYLSRRERLLRGSIPFSSAGEEEMLSIYLRGLGPDGRHDFVLPPGFCAVSFGEGNWEEFCRNPRRLAQIEADRVSYAWDALIEKFSHHAVNNTQQFAVPGTVAGTEEILRFMAAEPRTRRRMLASELLEMLETTPAHVRRTRLILPSRSGDPFYVFLLLPRAAEWSSREYREQRIMFLTACCQITKLMYPEALDIVGVATNTGNDEYNRSEDAVYIDARLWEEADNEEARALQEESGLLTSLKETKTVVRDYPDIERAVPKSKIGRNDPCFCGSRRKYKKCHGKALSGLARM